MGGDYYAPRMGLVSVQQRVRAHNFICSVFVFFVLLPEAHNFFCSVFVFFLLLPMVIVTAPSMHCWVNTASVRSFEVDQLANRALCNRCCNCLRLFFRSDVR